MYNNEEKAMYEYKKSQKKKMTLVLLGLLFGFILILFLLLFLATNLVRLIPKSWESKIGTIIKNSYIVDNFDSNKSREAQIILEKLNSEKLYSVYVVKNPQINAMALPGNIIIIYEGLYDKTTQDELYFVIGHELAHFKNRDHLKSFGRVILMGFAVNERNYDFMSYLLSKSLELINLGFSRDAEYKADEYSIKLLKEKKIDSSGAVSFMKKLQKENSVEPFEYFSTHPNTEDRIKKIESVK